MTFDFALLDMMIFVPHFEAVIFVLNGRFCSKLYFKLKGFQNPSLWRSPMNCIDIANQRGREQAEADPNVALMIFCPEELLDVLRCWTCGTEWRSCTKKTACSTVGQDHQGSRS